MYSLPLTEDANSYQYSLWLRQAINSSLEGLPLRLESGTVGSIVVQVPVQNLLTAPLSLTVDHLELALVLHPLRSNDISNILAYDHATDQLANSVVSVAQEFIHDELEANSLQESLLMEKKDHTPFEVADDDDMSSHIPGALDPFVNQPVVDPFHIQDTIEKESEAIDDVEGVSRLAHVVERLLARLSFSAKTITIRVLHKGNAEVILEIGSIVYSASEEQGEAVNPQSQPRGIEIGPIGGEKRTIRLIGFEVSIRDLQIPTQEDNSSETTIEERERANPLAGYQEDDDEEGEIDASMTQSMLSLPGPAESASGTIYFSTSSVRAHTPPAYSPEQGDSFVASNANPPDPVPVVSTTLPSTLSPATKILSTGKDPIVIALTTPRPTSLDPINVSQKLGLNITLGVITFAIETKQINSLFAMASLMPPPSSQTSQPPQQTQDSSSILSSIQTNVSLRAVLILLFRSYDSPPSFEMIENLFENPRTTQVSAPHARIHLEELHLIIPSKLPLGSVTGSSDEKITGSISDFSVFLVHSSGTTTIKSNEPELLIASPVLITDQNLSSQYDPDATEGSFAISVTNWTNKSHSSSRPKRTLWRTKPPPPKPGELGQKPKSQDAFTMRITKKSVVNAELVPLHFFVDTLMVGWVVGLVNEIDTPPKFGNQSDGRRVEEYGGPDTVITRPILRRSSTTTPRGQPSDLPALQGDEIEKQRLNDFILADMQGTHSDVSS